MRKRSPLFCMYICPVSIFHEKEKNQVNGKLMIF